MLTFEIAGLDRLEAELNSLGSSIGECLEDAVMAGGMVIANQGAENIKPYKTDASGTLASATCKPPRITRVGKYRVEGRVGPQGVPYGKIQEYGGVTGRGYRTRIQGKFYMTRAVESHRRIAENEMERIVREGINR